MFIHTLYEKTGSTSGIKRFRYKIKELLKEEGGVCDLLDYVMRYDDAKDMVIFEANSDFLEKQAKRDQAGG